MADITMCLNKKCSKREGCYRFKAPFNPYRQSVSKFKNSKAKPCEYYWPLKDEAVEESVNNERRSNSK
jgi:hypothetical protein